MFKTQLEPGMIIHCDNEKERRILYDELCRMGNIDERDSDDSWDNFNTVDIDFEIKNMANGGWGFAYRFCEPTHNLSDLLSHEEVQFKEGTAIHCPTAKDAVKLFEILRQQGYRWASGDILEPDDTYSYVYREKTCYRICPDQRIKHTSSDTFKQMFPECEIVEFADIVKTELKEKAKMYESKESVFAFKEGTAIHCATEEDAIKLFETLKQQGYRWNDATLLDTDDTGFGDYGSNTCYFITSRKRIVYGTASHAKVDAIPIIEFSEIVPTLPTLETIKQAHQILNKVDERVQELANEVGFPNIKSFEFNTDYTELIIVCAKDTVGRHKTYTFPTEWLYDEKGAHKDAYVKDEYRERAEYERLKAKFEPEAEEYDFEYEGMV